MINFLAAHLALLAGVEVDELPEQIRHWNKLTPYVGNSILDRIDPEDWFLRDDWREDFHFQVAFALSKSFMKDLRRQYGFPKIDWNKYNDD